jgi:hypothetical protein
VFVPLQIAAELHSGAATAATWRIAIALLSVTRQRRDYYVDKPRIAKLAAVRMDNAERLLGPVRALALPDGEPVFESIQYAPGVRRSLAGQINVVLSQAAAAMVIGPEIEIHDDEFARYTYATSLTLRMRAGAEQYRRGHKSVRWRLGIEGATELLGPAVERAGSQRGFVSLARAWHNAVEPAVIQLNEVSKAFRIVSTITQQTEVAGSPWLSIDLEAHRVSSSDPLRTESRKSLKQLGQREAYKAMVRDNLR